MSLSVFIAYFRIRGDYYYNGNLRWDLGLPTPNLAGCLIATILPFIWVIYNQRLLSLGKLLSFRPFIARIGIAFLLEVVITYIVCKTYSRGSILAVAITIAVNGILNAKLAPSFPSAAKFAKCTTIFRLAILLSCLLLTGALGRVSNAVSAEDNSVRNRLKFWVAASEMFSADPLKGCGYGNSGYVYMNWYQHYDNNAAFATPANSYLHILLENGAIVFIFFTATILLPVITYGIKVLPTSTNAIRSLLSIAAMCTVTSWLICNAFSTLWQDLRINLIPLGAIVLLFSQLRDISWRKLSTYYMRIMACISIMLFCFYIAGNLSRKRNTILIDADKTRCVMTLNTPMRLGKAVQAEAWLDSAVLGFPPGKQLRKFIEGTSKNILLTVHSEFEPPTILENSPDAVILFGRQAQRIDFVIRANKIVVVCPSGMPPHAWTSETQHIIFILPSYDENGETTRWKNWAVANGFRIQFVNGYGTNIQDIGPDIVMNTF